MGLRRRHYRAEPLVGCYKQSPSEYRLGQVDLELNPQPKLPSVFKNFMSVPLNLSMHSHDVVNMQEDNYT